MALLRASSQHSGEAIDLKTTIGAGEGDGGIPHGQLLVEFAEAVLDPDAGRLERARAAVRETLGDAALVDACGVAATFNAIDRVADSTGIPLEDDKAEATADFRSDLGIDSFAPMAG